MKKLLPILLALVAFTVFACVVLATPNNVLYFLNWGEYIDMSLVEEFEKEFHCQVVVEVVTSSEAMYQKIVSGTTAYDVAVPGDYTVNTLYQEGYLKPFDVENADYPNLRKGKSLFDADLVSLMDRYMVDAKTGESYSSYYFPYFCGTYSLIYSTDKPDVPSTVEENGFASLYDRGLFGETVKIGMYDTARWIVASALLSEGKDPNITNDDGSTEGDISPELKSRLIEKIRAAKFDEFGNDSLKRDVANGSCDFCYTQLGDFFDTLSLVFSEGKGKQDISFNVSVPEVTAAFFDSMVIPTTSRNYALANAFVDFMMDTDHAYQNARDIGYSPTLSSVAEKFEQEASDGAYFAEGESEEQSLTLREFLSSYPMYLHPLAGCKQVYMLESKSTAYLSTCETIFNALA